MAPSDLLNWRVPPADVVLRHILTSFGALMAATGAAVLMAWWAGFDEVRSVFENIDAGWVVAAIVAQVPAISGYCLAYDTVGETVGTRGLGIWGTIRAVLAGFGALSTRAGFGFDRRLLAHRDGQRPARMHVLVLGVLEYAPLAPVAWVTAIVLLAQHSQVDAAVLWPWAICVPVGTVLALLAVRSRSSLSANGRRRRVAEVLEAARVQLRMSGEASPAARAHSGMALYWFGEGLSLYAACRSVGVSIGLGQLILALGSGYALTRRSLPFAGAAVTLVFMSLALHWVGLSLASAVAATVVYRVATLVLPTLPALLAAPRVDAR